MPNPHLPSDAALQPGFKDYIDSFAPEYRSPMCMAMLRLLITQRAYSCEDGDALKSLAKMEIEVISALENIQNPAAPKTVYGQPPT